MPTANALKIRLLPGVLLVFLAASPAQTPSRSEAVAAPDQPSAAETATGNAAPTLDPLPDAPGASATTASSSSAAEAAPGTSGMSRAEDGMQAPGQPGSKLPRHASPLDTTVAAGQIAPSQTARDKVLGSMKDSISPFAIAGNVISAGYSHWTNGSPNYGTDGTAFAQRFGASMARGSSQSIFANGVMASVLHQDPRYYQLGSKYSILHRGVYAATRPLIGRTDSGKKIPNVALLTGYLGAAFLTRTYYPEKNQTVSENLQTYGSSLGGAAIGFAVNEFLPQVLQAVHLNRFGRNGQ